MAGASTGSWSFPTATQQELHDAARPEFIEHALKAAQLLPERLLVVKDGGKRLIAGFRAGIEVSDGSGHESGLGVDGDIRRWREGHEHWSICRSDLRTHVQRYCNAVDDFGQDVKLLPIARGTLTPEEESEVYTRAAASDLSAKDWLLAQLQALSDQQSGPVAVDHEVFRVMRAERWRLLQDVILAVKRDVK